MFQQLLKNQGLRMNGNEFIKVLNAATQDIKFNKIKFGKRTNLNELLEIMKTCYKVVKDAA